MTNIKTPKAIDDNPQPLEDEKGNRTTLSVGQKSIVVDGEIYVNIPAGEHNTNQFVVVDGGQLKTRTGAEVLADIGDAGGDITQVSFTSLDDFSVQTVSSGNADFTTNGTNGITTSMSAGPVISITGVNASTSAHGVVQLIDEDNMSSDSATRVPTQQSVKAYVDNEVAGLVDSAPAALDTLDELAAALGDDENFATTVTNSIATKLPLAGGTMTGDLIIAADNKIKSDTEPTRNFIEFDDDSGSPANQTLVSSITNVALIVDANGNDVGQFEVLKAGTDSTATELFRIENDGDAVFTGDITVSGTVDGRDIATDGSKLDGIEAGATADQTQADINGLAITTTGALDSGSITSGFGSIDNGSSSITTTGAISGGSVSSDGSLAGKNLALSPDTLTSSSSADDVIRVAQVLNAGSGENSGMLIENFSMFKSSITDTDSSGWDNVYHINAITGSTTKFSVNKDGDVNAVGKIDGGSSVYLKEAASASADTGGKGQLWVKNDTPNNLYFTNDAGNDVQITNGSSLAGGSGGTSRWAHSCGGYKNNNNTTNYYFQYYPNRYFWGNAESSPTSISYTDLYAAEWQAPAAGTLTKIDAMVRASGATDDCTFYVYKASPSVGGNGTTSLTLIGDSGSCGIDSTTQTFYKSATISSSNTFSAGDLLFVMFKKDSTSASTQHTFTVTISGEYS